MRESAVIDIAQRHPFDISWERKYFGNDAVGDRTKMEDVEPVSRVPVPSAFTRPTVDPLLTITPEKNLGLIMLRKQKPEGGSGCILNKVEKAKKGRQRVRFAPETITSPPSPRLAEGESSSRLGPAADPDSMPRNFPAITDRLYRHGLYSNEDSVAPSASAFASRAGVPEQNRAEKPGTDTLHAVKSTRGILPEYSDHSDVKTVTTVPGYDSSVNKEAESGSDTEVGRAFEGAQTTGQNARSPYDDIRGGSSSNQKAYVRSFPSTSHSLSARPTRRQTSPSSPSHLFSGSTSSRSSARSPDRQLFGLCSPSAACDGEVQLLTDDEEDAPKGVKVVREAPLRPKIQQYDFPFSTTEQDAAYDSNLENPFARPEFNSSLKISQELRNAKAKKTDTWGVVTDTLNKNQQKRTQIQEKASSKVNIQMQSGLYSGLVDLDLPVDQLCNNFEREITLRAPVTVPAPAKVPVGKEPDIMEFFSPDLQKELPDLSLLGLPTISEELTKADPMLAFDLYRHNRSWNGLSDS